MSECSLSWFEIALARSLTVSLMVQKNSFNVSTDTMEILLLWQLRKIVPSLEVLPTITSSMHTAPPGFILCCLDFIEPIKLILLIFCLLKLCVSSEAWNNWKVHTTLDLPLSMVWGNKGPVTIVASSESVKGLLKQQALKQPKLARLGKVLYKWLTAVHFKEKFYDSWKS